MRSKKSFCQKYALSWSTLLESAKDSLDIAVQSAKVTGHKLLQMPKVLERIGSQSFKQ